MSVTRAEVSAYVSTAFIGGGATRFDLITLAKAGHAPVEVLSVLAGLPHRRFGRLCEVWELLPDLPPAAPRDLWWDGLRAA